MNVTDRFWLKVIKGESCWEWQAQRGHWGHGVFWFEGKSVKAHRFSYELSHGSIPDGLMVRHKCDNPCCVNPEHLELGSHIDNMKDMVERGRSPVRERNAASKLTKEQVDEILKDPRGHSVVARDYGVSNQLVSRLRGTK